MRATTVLVAILAACSAAPEPAVTPAPGGGPPPAPPPPPSPVADATTAAAGPDAGPCAGPPPTPDHVCVRDCGPPVVREGDPPPGWSWLSPEQARSREQYGCPVCLPADARIATPAGDVAVAELAAGAPVITLDASGRRTAARVLLVRSVPAPEDHAMVRVTLTTGEVVTASGPHPLPDGRALGALRPGDPVGDARVTAVEVVAYAGERTWDLVVSGPTGLYVADGVVLRSTIADRATRRDTHDVPAASR